MLSRLFLPKKISSITIALFTTVYVHDQEFKTKAMQDWQDKLKQMEIRIGSLEKKSEHSWLDVSTSYEQTKESILQGGKKALFLVGADGMGYKTHSTAYSKMRWNVFEDLATYLPSSALLTPLVRQEIIYRISSGIEGHWLFAQVTDVDMNTENLENNARVDIILFEVGYQKKGIWQFLSIKNLETRIEVRNKEKVVVQAAPVKKGGNYKSDDWPGRLSDL